MLRSRADHCVERDSPIKGNKPRLVLDGECQKVNIGQRGRPQQRALANDCRVDEGQVVGDKSMVRGLGRAFA